MVNIRRSLQQYIDWVIRLGRLKFSLLGIVILAIFALCVQGLLSLFFIGHIYWLDLARSIGFGLISAPFVIYFFNVIVEKLERSRQHLSETNKQLSQALSRLELEIHEKNQAQLALAQKAEFLRSFIDASPDLVFSRSDKGILLECNRSMELLTGKTRAELTALSTSEIFSTDTATYINETDQAVLMDNMGMTYEQWHKYPNGKSACFEIRKVPYYDRLTQQHCIMGFGRDITERKRYQETIEKASRDKTTLMATISHELRTPLNGIIGLSQMLLDTDLDTQQRNYLRTINVSAISLGHIFSDIIDLEKLDTRRIKLFKKETIFSALINDISNFASFMTQQKGLTFRIKCGENLPECVLIDQARVSQILWNLVSNAVKFTQQGSITLTVKRIDKKQVSFAVTDTGIGISKSEQRKIFAMFYQVTTDKQKALGSGIGLAISKRIAKLMQGDLSVESELGQGATFTFTFQAEEVSCPKAIQQNVILPGLNILLVDDIEINVVVAKSLLEKLGYEIDVATNGQEAIEKFEQNNYDLLLLDIQLPDMTGFDIAQHLRQGYEQERYDYLPPLVALTANVVRDKKVYLQQGMDDVLQKPLSVESFNQSLEQIFALNVSTKQPEIVEENTQITELMQNVHFDGETLQQLIAMLGKDFVLNNLSLLEETMPDYLAELDQQYQHYLVTGESQPLAKAAHKIKGAAASMGLKRVQQIAKLAQQDTQSEWATHIAQWLEQIHSHWHSDIQYLQQQLK